MNPDGYELAAAELPDRRVRSILTSLVVPRPIAWVSSVSGDGVRNLAPHSFFNIASLDPPIVHFTSSRRDDHIKDTLANVVETGEFVVNLVDRSLAASMNLTSAELAAEEDEFSWARVAAAPGTLVAPPYVRDAPAAIECTVQQTLDIGNGTMVFGRVVWFHLASRAFDGHRVDPAGLDPVARIGGPFYTSFGDVFRMDPPSADAHRESFPAGNAAS
ncbi:flavin reductase family protein [Amycolatopsis jejuensis]|uniref:flavin reductase family protein n=1 Tax=Amycolatopsis jejuensis TaxID=330084 RepID=UPI00069069D2|nr:flavin reductase family protein [Amycolatopsis jejuensis]